MKKLTSLFLSLLVLLSLTGCGGGSEELAGAVLDAAIDAVVNYESESESEALEIIGGADGPTSILVTGPEKDDSSAAESTPFIPTEGGYYYDLENVVLYIEYYGELPDNYITKDEARALGWKGGTPERYLEGSAIGGDRFGNREGLLPKGNYTECDLNTLGEDERGAERLVFSDSEYYYTEDHYESFTQVWVENGEVIYE
jgi:hypothetical protein